MRGVVGKKEDYKLIKSFLAKDNKNESLTEEEKANLKRIEDEYFIDEMSEEEHKVGEESKTLTVFCVTVANDQVQVSDSVSYPEFAKAKNPNDKLENLYKSRTRLLPDNTSNLLFSKAPTKP